MSKVYQMFSYELLRRLLLTGAGLLALTPAAVFAQHEVDAEADLGPIVISSNENAFGFSQMAMMAMMEDVQQVNRYGRDNVVALVNLIAEREGVSPSWVMPTPGSGPFLLTTALAFAEPGKNVVTVAPGYTQLTEAFKKFGGDVITVPLNDKLEYDFEALSKAINEDTVMVYICNPNNPTGTCPDPEAIKSFIRGLPDGVVAFVDEAYLELAEGGLDKHTMRTLVQEGEDLVIARTFSKVYGMAGARIGYGFGKPEIMEKIAKYNIAGGPSRVGAAGALAALNDAEFYDFSVTSYQTVRKMVTDRFDELGLTYAKPNGSFVFVKTGIPIQALAPMMEARNIRIGRAFPPLLDWARVSIGTEQEMRTFLAVFEEILRAQGKIAMSN